MLSQQIVSPRLESIPVDAVSYPLLATNFSEHCLHSCQAFLTDQRSGLQRRGWGKRGPLVPQNPAIGMPSRLG